MFGTVKMPLPMEDTMPSWMQGERYIYCDRFESDYVHAPKESLWKSIIHFFS